MIRLISAATTTLCIFLSSNPSLILGVNSDQDKSFDPSEIFNDDADLAISKVLMKTGDLMSVDDARDLIVREAGKDPNVKTGVRQWYDQLKAMRANLEDALHTDGPAEYKGMGGRFWKSIIQAARQDSSVADAMRAQYDRVLHELRVSGQELGVIDESSSVEVKPHFSSASSSLPLPASVDTKSSSSSSSSLLSSSTGAAVDSTTSSAGESTSLQVPPSSLIEAEATSSHHKINPATAKVDPDEQVLMMRELPEIAVKNDFAKIMDPVIADLYDGNPVISEAMRERYDVSSDKYVPDKNIMDVQAVWSTGVSK